MKILKLLTVCLIALIHFSAKGQTSHIVDVTNNKFTPIEVTITQGDTVIWTNSEGKHNINGTQDTFSENPESFGNDVAVGWVFSHVFTTVGTYDYQCDPHVRSQMFGKVIVEEELVDPTVSSVEDARVSASLELYPNPAIGELNITLDEEIESISIFDIRGAQISTYTNIQSRQALVNLEDVTPGIYLLELKTVDNRGLFSRFIKK